MMILAFDSLFEVSDVLRFKIDLTEDIAVVVLKHIDLCGVSKKKSKGTEIERKREIETERERERDKRKRERDIDRQKKQGEGE